MILPTLIGAERIAELLLYRNVAVMLEGTDDNANVARDLRRLGLELEVLAAASNSQAAGRTVGELEQLAGGAFLVVGLNRRAGESLIQPPAAAVIQPGDGVAVVGRPGRAAQVASLFTELKSRRVSARG